MIKKDISKILISIIMLLPSIAFSQPLFSPATIEIPIPEILSYSVADYNGDGYKDIAVLNKYSHSADILIYLMQSTGSYTTNEVNDIEGQTISAGDINGDSNIDLLVSDTTGYLYLLLGNGNGTFGNPDTIDVSVWGLSEIPRLGVVGNFNTDNYADLVYGDTLITKILLGQGNGNFFESNFFDISGKFEGFASAGDLDNDGDIDIILPVYRANFLDPSDSVAVLLNNGSGSFQLGGTFPAGIISVVTDYFTDVDLGYFDGDNYLDIVTAPSMNYGSDDPVITFLKGNGDGTFGNPVTSETDTTELSAFHPIDINLDGSLDLVALPLLLTFRNDIAVMVGDGNGNFGLPIWYPVPGTMYLIKPDDLTANDFNDDGFQDVIFKRSHIWSFEGLEILLGNGDATFQTAPLYEIDLGPRSVASADFNGDSYPDLATANSDSNTITILLNDGDGSFDNISTDLPVPGTPFIIKTADMNNDNRADLIFSDTLNYRLLVRLGDGTGGFGTIFPYDLPGNLNDIVIGDFNEDNNPDASVCISGDAKKVLVLLGNGSGSFTDTTQLDFSYPLAGIAAADYDNDGHLDLAVDMAYFLYASLYIYYGDGNGGFPQSQQYSSLFFGGLWWNGVETADFNNDNYPDVIFWQDVTGEIWLNDGQGGMVNNDTLMGNVGYNFGMTLHDFNGDFNIDIATGSGDLISIYLGDGTGDFYSSHYSYVGVPYPLMGLSSFKPLCADDYNRDGLIDLAVVQPDTDRVAILFGQAGFTHDIGVVSILQPAGQIPLDIGINPEAELINLGIETDTFDVYFHIGSVFYDTVEAILDAGQRDTVVFSSWVPAQTDDYSTACGVIFAADENPLNNLLTGSVTVVDTSLLEIAVNSIWPNSAGNIGWITTTIIGENFVDGADIRLTRSGQTDIVAGSYQTEITEVISSSEIRAVFNLDGASTGYWDVVVTNPDDGTDTLDNGFEVITGDQHLWLDISGIANVNVTGGDIPVTYKVYAGNNGNVNLDRVILRVEIPDHLKLLSIVDFDTGDTIAYGDSLEAYDIVDTTVIVPFYISALHPGEMKIYDFNMETVWDNYQGGGKRYDGYSEGANFGVKGSLMNSAICFGKNLYNSYEDTGDLTQDDFEDAGEAALENLGEGLFWGAIKFGIQILFPVTIPFIQAYDLAVLIYNGADLVGQLAGLSQTELAIILGIFIDPNDKTGPTGFGEGGYITGNRPFTYTIYCQNADTATLPVPIVEVVDTLDPDLDWSTLEFGESKHSLTSMVLDTSGGYGIVTFTFEDINLPPDTLPPNGQSWFTYTIWPDSDLVSGDSITNQASIIFRDSLTANEPILTSTVLNIIDSEPPQSSMNSLPATMNSVAFRLSWSGSDSESGIYTYHIFASEDDGEYELWRDLPDTSDVFIGKNGSTYGFYSVAIDNVGYTEARPDEPDVLTSIDADDDIGVSPNPFVPSRGHTTMTFFGGSLANSTIKIYNKAGRLICTLEETSGESTLEWDGTNDDGEKLASGVYIWFLKGPAGEDKGKFAIIR